jgi:hypothetical protein
LPVHSVPPIRPLNWNYIPLIGSNLRQRQNTILENLWDFCGMAKKFDLRAQPEGPLKSQLWDALVRAPRFVGFLRSTTFDLRDRPRYARYLRMSRLAWNLGDGPEQLSYAATSSFGV